MLLLDSAHLPPAPAGRTAGGMARRAARRPAFTIAELVTVLCVIGTIAAIATPRYAASLARYRVGSAARRLVADLEVARSQAASSNASQRVAFAGDAYELPGVKPLHKASGAYAVDLAADPYRVTVVSADFGGDAEVVFDVFGGPDSAGTVVLRAGDTEQTVVLDAGTGRGQIQ